jgi:hypothetical protein
VLLVQGQWRIIGMAEWLGNVLRMGFEHSTSLVYEQLVQMRVDLDIA